MAYLSVIIPAYNEEKRIGATLERIHGYCRSKHLDVEIIVINDGSRDGTGRVLDDALRRMSALRVLFHPYRRGKGAAVTTGMLQTTGEIVLLTDADLSAPMEEFEPLHAVLREGYDVAIGSRALAGSRIGRHQMWLRELMGRAFNVLIRLFVLADFRDTQCGFKLFRGDAARGIFAKVRTRGFAFDVEALYIAKRWGLRIREVPVAWAHCGNSRVNIVLSPVMMMCDLIFIKARGWLGIYRRPFKL